MRLLYFLALLFYSHWAVCLVFRNPVSERRSPSQNSNAASRIALAKRREHVPTPPKDDSPAKCEADDADKSQCKCTAKGNSLLVKKPDGVECCSYPAKDLICNMRTDDSTVNVTWHASGAEDWLDNFLKQKGALKWTESFFSGAYVKGSRLGGSNNACENLQEDRCPNPADDGCPPYDPPETYFVQLAMFNYWDTMKTLVNSALLSTLNGTVHVKGQIVDTYGVPNPGDTNAILLQIMGSLLLGAGFLGLGPIFAEGAEMASAAGALATNVAGGVNIFNARNPDAKPTKVDADRAIEEVLGNAFNGIVSGITSNANKVLGVSEDNPPAKPSGIVGGPAPVTPGSNILATFAGGKYLNGPALSKATGAWSDAFAKLTKDAMMASHLNHKRAKQDWHIILVPRGTKYADKNDLKTQKSIDDQTCKTAGPCAWVSSKDSCACMGWPTTLAAGTASFVLPPDDLAQSLRQDISDFDAAMTNNVECTNKKEMTADDLAKLTPFDGTNTKQLVTYPSCFWTFDVISLTDTVWQKDGFFSNTPVVGASGGGDKGPKSGTGGVPAGANRGGPGRGPG